MSTVWNKEQYDKIDKKLRKEAPQVYGKKKAMAGKMKYRVNDESFSAHSSANARVQHAQKHGYNALTNMDRVKVRKSK